MLPRAILIEIKALPDRIIAELGRTGPDHERLTLWIHRASFQGRLGPTFQDRPAVAKVARKLNISSQSERKDGAVSKLEQIEHGSGIGKLETLPAFATIGSAKNRNPRSAAIM